MNGNTEESEGGSGGGWMSVLSMAAAFGGMTALALFDRWITAKEEKNMTTVDELEKLLVERQHLFCSTWTSKSDLEQKNYTIMEKAKLLPVPNVKVDLEKIFKEDQSCGSTVMYLITGNKANNGSIMWEILRHWREAEKKNT